MGRIKTVPLKSKTFDLMEKHGDFFKDSYEDNKKKVQEFALFKSKKIRNIVAGYITRLHKKKSKEN